MLSHNSGQLQAELEVKRVRTVAVVYRAVSDAANLLETAVKANMVKADSPVGLDKPRVVTGHYQSSWTHEVRQSGARVQAVVGTAAPQGRRLEYGFTGPDRLGRVFNQHPRPHVQPAVDTVDPVFQRSIREIIEE